MKRRDFLVVSAGTAGAMIPLLSRAAQPCPPGQVSVSGGSSASTPCVVSSPGDSYTTNFPTTENPLSEGGVWTNGGSTGIDWQNVAVEAGTAYPSNTSGASHYDDCLAIIKGRFTPTKHYAEMVYRRDAGYSPPSSQEVELLLGFDITAHNARGYEMDFMPALEPVRWNGPLDNFQGQGAVPFTTLSGGSFAPGDGDVVRVNFDSSSGSPVFTVFLNGAQRWQFTDRTSGKILSGSPGIGFFARAGSGLNLKRIGMRSFTGGSL